MPPQPQPISAKDLQGFKYLNEVMPPLQHLHCCGTGSDKAGNRPFFTELIDLVGEEPEPDGEVDRAPNRAEGS